jgi:hypothetical protein
MAEVSLLHCLKTIYRNQYFLYLFDIFGYVFYQLYSETIKTFHECV